MKSGEISIEFPTAGPVVNGTKDEGAIRWVQKIHTRAMQLFNARMADSLAGITLPGVGEKLGSDYLIAVEELPATIMLPSGPYDGEPPARLINQAEQVSEIFWNVVADRLTALINDIKEVASEAGPDARPVVTPSTDKYAFYKRFFGADYREQPGELAIMGIRGYLVAGGYGYVLEKNNPNHFNDTLVVLFHDGEHGRCKEFTGSVDPGTPSRPGRPEVYKLNGKPASGQGEMKAARAQLAAERRRAAKPKEKVAPVTSADVVERLRQTADDLLVTATGAVSQGEQDLAALRTDVAARLAKWRQWLEAMRVSIGKEMSLGPEKATLVEGLTRGLREFGEEIGAAAKELQGRAGVIAKAANGAFQGVRRAKAVITQVMTMASDLSDADRKEVTSRAQGAAADAAACKTSFEKLVADLNELKVREQAEPLLRDAGGLRAELVRRAYHQNEQAIKAAQAEHEKTTGEFYAAKQRYDAAYTTRVAPLEERFKAADRTYQELRGGVKTEAERRTAAKVAAFEAREGRNPNVKERKRLVDETRAEVQGELAKAKKLRDEAKAGLDAAQADLRKAGERRAAASEKLKKETAAVRAAAETGKKALAHLKEGQYEYGLGWHYGGGGVDWAAVKKEAGARWSHVEVKSEKRGGKVKTAFEALNITGGLTGTGESPVERDVDASGGIEAVGEDVTLFGHAINIHYGGRAGGTTVGSWSEGCQIIRGLDDYNEFIGYVKRDKDLKVSYRLIGGAKLAGGGPREPK